MPDNDALLLDAQLPSLPRRELHNVHRHLNQGVPGRKWQQVCAFASAMQRPGGELVEWCSGKGFLGRLLASVDDCSVSSLEHNADLVAAGQSYTKKHGLKQQFFHVDVYQKSAQQLLQQQGGVVALHACGDLHVHLLRAASQEPLRELYLAPCCYHLTSDAVYQPLSVLAQQSRLSLSKALLKFAVQGVSTGGRRAQRERNRELIWRMAFDQWQRRVRSEENYQPLPGIPGRFSSRRFEDFMQWACGLKSLPMPSAKELMVLLEQGEARALAVRRAELVSSVYRRPLEVWLLLDRAMYLTGSYQRVELGVFCSEELTPRNAMLTAVGGQ